LSFNVEFVNSNKLSKERTLSAYRLI